MSTTFYIPFHSLQCEQSCTKLGFKSILNVANDGFSTDVVDSALFIIEVSMHAFALL